MAKISKKPGNYLYPLPPCLITCGPAETANIITLTWAGSLCSEPPVMGVSIRPSRHSHPLVKDSGEFAINLPTTKMLQAVDWCGNFSGRDHDKFAVMGLTRVPATLIKTALIAECPLNLECQVVQTVTLGSHDLFLGKVVAVHVEESLLNSEGEIDLGRAEALAYGGHAYWNVGGFLERQGYTAKK
jgi:flavin reductase (DIM6/NTAB) family NADH-FMN oxidoreductase RutF